MSSIRKILSLILLIATALTPALAKPVNNQRALHDLKKPLKTLVTSSRPSRDYHYLSPGGHFIIHYDNTGDKMVPQHYTFNDSIPDFVYKAAEYLDSSYRMLKDTLGFNAPPTDNIESPEIDVYFYINSGNSLYYGLTEFESQVGSAWTSYLSLSTLLNDSTIFYTYGLEGLSVTCAHELFHIFQLGYKFRDQDVFYFEMSSVWFEEYMFPDVNDYHSYVNQYAQSWNYAINSGVLDYNNAGFNLYIDQRFSQAGNNIINNIWDRILNVNALSAIREELLDQGSRFEEALKDWGTAQVLCGPYSAANFRYPFDDAGELNTISFDNNTSNIITSLEADMTLDHDPMASYYKITNLPDQILLFETILPDGADANLICLDGDQSKVYHIETSTPIVIDGFQFNDGIMAIGSDVDNANISFAFTAISADQMAALYPNPLSQGQALNLSYVLLENNLRGHLAIYDLIGRKIYSKSLENDLKNTGLHDLSFVPTDLSSGIYIVALHFDDTVIAEKFTYLK